MFASIGEITGVGRGPRRTGQPVRRNSHTAGRCEGVFWQRTTRREVRQVLLAARRYELATRQQGTRYGALGSVALEVLELLTNLIHDRTGRLDPSYDYLMRKLKRSRDAIARALAALRAHGFLDWLRRTVPVETEGRGPRVRQTSNAYRLLLPARARRLLGRMGEPAPPPDDHTHRIETQAAELEAMKAALPMADRLLSNITDPGLELALRGLIEARQRQQERESAKRTESRSKLES